MSVPNSPEVQRMIAETKALSTMLACVSKASSCDAPSLVRPLWEGRRPQDAEGWLQHLAMARLLGEKPPLPELEAGREAASRLFVRTARAWMLWAVGEQEEARKVLTTTICEPGPGPDGGEIHLMALGPWCRGVGALLGGNREEARRFFRRSMELGSQLGTETNNAIQWAYVATFFEHAPPTS